MTRRQSRHRLAIVTPPLERRRCCEPGLTAADRRRLSPSLRQANAARDELYDLRECKMSGTDAGGFDLSGALMEKGDFSGTNFKESQLSKAYAPGAKFDGADFSNGVVDRAYFNGASFKARLGWQLGVSRPHLSHI